MKKIFITLCLILTIIPVFVFSTGCNKKEDKIIKIPVALRDLEPGTQITSKDIIYITEKESKIDKKAILDIHSIIGKYVADSKIIKKDSMFYPSDLVDEIDND